MADDWYRNTEWNEVIARQFEAKLRRARRKEQYLRLQASMLAESAPEVALELLERYFEMPDQFDRAPAFVDRATALLALGKVDDALDAYEAALAREAAFPNVLTQACLDFPFLVASKRIRPRFARALEILDAHADRPRFPIEHFWWHAARALLLREMGDVASSSAHASSALDAAAQESSGLRYHSRVGLVGEACKDVIEELRGLAASGATAKAGEDEPTRKA